MKREIKFRAWNTKYNEMIYLQPSGLQYFDFEGSYSLGFTVDGYSQFWAHEQYDTSTKEAKKFPIMQFTGLLDKNGKEIYEGDILSVDERRIIGKPTPQQAFKGYVKYSTQAACWWIMSVHGDKERYNELSIGGQYGDENGIQLTSIEVIGNIHENPELLK